MKKVISLRFRILNVLLLQVVSSRSLMREKKKKTVSWLSFC